MFSFEKMKRLLVAKQHCLSFYLGRLSFTGEATKNPDEFIFEYFFCD